VQRPAIFKFERKRPWVCHTIARSARKCHLLFDLLLDLLLDLEAF
jgi:hypothetical protein